MEGLLQAKLQWIRTFAEWKLRYERQKLTPLILIDQKLQEGNDLVLIKVMPLLRGELPRSEVHQVLLQMLDTHYRRPTKKFARPLKGNDEGAC